VRDPDSQTVAQTLEINIAVHLGSEYDLLHDRFFVIDPSPLAGIADPLVS
jgi:hypothetical protein